MLLMDSGGGNLPDPILASFTRRHGDVWLTVYVIRSYQWSIPGLLASHGVERKHTTVPPPASHIKIRSPSYYQTLVIPSSHSIVELSYRGISKHL